MIKLELLKVSDGDLADKGMMVGHWKTSQHWMIMVTVYHAYEEVIIHYCDELEYDDRGNKSRDITPQKLMDYLLDNINSFNYDTIVNNLNGRFEFMGEVYEYNINA